MGCPFCDAAVPKGARYCPSCGTALVGGGRRGARGYDDGGWTPGPGPATAYWSQQPARTSTAAVISLIAGLATWSVLPLLGALIAIPTGHAALREIHESRGHVEGHGAACVGLFLSYAQMLLVLLGIGIGALMLVSTTAHVIVH